ncbi:MAG: hypothetical protein K6T16_00770 [Candidatus Pacearchaeota archaeon]|nr:hypothetical protein [Candidatus Pacearchaeota archaeon]
MKGKNKVIVLMFFMIVVLTATFLCTTAQAQTSLAQRDQGNIQLADASTRQGYVMECMTKDQCEQEGGEYKDATECGDKLEKGCCYFEKCTSFPGYGWVKKDYQQVDCKQNTIKTNVTDKREGEVCCELVQRGESQETPPPPGLLGRLDLCIFHGGVAKKTITKEEDAKKLIDKGVKLEVVGNDSAGKPNKWAYNVSITLTECIFNYISLAWGGIWASVLTFQGGDKRYGTCKPEKPIMGLSEDEQERACLSCMEDPYRICTKERCEILGNCIAVPTEKAGSYKCIAGKCEEKGLVGMTDGRIEWYIDGTLNGSMDAEIGDRNIRTDLGEIPFNTKSIVINLTTDQPAQCRWVLDTRGANFSGMTDFEENYYPTLPGGSADWQYAVVELPGTVARGEEHKIFIKCKNACGSEHEAGYDQNYVQFKLAKKPDQLPPEIVYIDPSNNAVIRGDLGNITASFWLDELGNCKYSDKTMNYTLNYTQMKYFSERPNENSSVMLGKCYPGNCTHLTMARCTHCELLLNLTRGYEELNFSGMPPEMQSQLDEMGLYNTTKFFRFMIRCEDTAKNIMIEEDTLSYGFITMPGYNITVLKPEMDERTYDRLPEIVVTSEPRETQCRYKTYVGSGPKTPPAWDEMQFIDELMATLHEGRHNETLNASKTGMQHTLWARCRDKWHIEATNYTRFYTLLDEDAPVIMRMYHDTSVGDYLIIETDDNSTCVYGTSDTIKCNYNFSDGNAMTGTLEPVHAAYWSLENLYYIKCVDDWNNYPGGRPNANACTAVINPYEVPPL